MNDQIEAQLADLGRNLPAADPEVTRRARTAVLGATPRGHRPLVRLLPTAVTLVVAAVAVMVLLIVAPNGNHERPVAESERVGTGPSLVIPKGWSGTAGAYRVPCCAGSNRVVRVTNAPAIPPFASDQDGAKAAAALNARQMIIEVTTYPGSGRSAWPVARLPIRVGAGDFRLPYEGQLTRVLAVKNLVVGGVPTTIRVGIDPLPRPVAATPALPAYGPPLIDQANKVLASLQLSDAPAALVPATSPTCAVTRPTRQDPTDTSGTMGFHGTPALTTGLPMNGRLPVPAQMIDGERVFRAKFGFGTNLDPSKAPAAVRPPLTVRAVRLDGPGRVGPVAVNPVYGVVGPIALDFPSRGCWRMSARLGPHKLQATLKLVQR